jgi:4-hydroxy-3-methylbut-2-enyl diphosphate reductase
MLVDRASEIDWSRLAGIRTLGVSAGASAPEKLVDEVIEAFAQRYDIKVEARVTAKENIAFNIPRELRAIEAAVAR